MECGGMRSCATCRSRGKSSSTAVSTADMGSLSPEALDCPAHAVNMSSDNHGELLWASCGHSGPTLWTIRVQAGENAWSTRDNFCGGRAKKKPPEGGFADDGVVQRDAYAVSPYTVTLTSTTTSVCSDTD